MRIKVVKGLYSHFKSGSDSLITSENNLIRSIDKSYELYFQMLGLAVDVKNYADERIEIARNKKLPTHEDLNPNLRFVNNRLVAQLEEDEELQKIISKKALGWVRYPELIKHLYSKMIESDYYKKYMASAEDSYTADLDLLSEFYLMTIQDDELLESVVEEQSIMWCDDVDYILIMVLRTFEGCRENQKQVPLRRQYKNEDDIRFVKELFRHTVVKFDEYQTYIDRFTQNWDVERIAFIDNVIMATAISEFVVCESIPVKVTMDEYIEISKYYSTNGSSVFINGVLDKIADTLTEEGKINKSGRGLL